MWTQRAAAVAPSIIGGMFGGGKSQKVSQEAIDAGKQAAQQGYFKPVTVTSSLGGAGVGTQGNLVSQMTPQYQDIVNKALAGAGGVYGALANFVPAERAAEIYKEQLSLLEPSFQQQATDLQSRLFGSGRLGLRLAGESQGLGTGSGMVQPDALGLGRAQQQTMAQVAAGSRQQALDEANALANLGASMLTGGLSVNQAEAEMIKLGVDAETARAAAAYAAGNLMMSPYTGAMQAAAGYDQNRAGLFGGITTGLLSNPNFMNSGGTPAATSRGLSIARNDPYRIGGTFGD